MSDLKEGPLDVDGIFSQFGDIFGQFFGGGAGTGGRSASRDVTLLLELTLEEASEGTKRRVEVARFFRCTVCAGRGAPEDAPVSECQACKGAGKSVQTQGFFTVQAQCQGCRGRGKIFAVACDGCDGVGGETRTEVLTMQVPAGVADGHRLRMAGKGNDLGDEKGAGDVYATVRVTPDERIARVGDDFVTTAEVAAEVARDGGEVEVRIPGGEVRVPVPAGMKDGAEVRLPGYGSVKLGSPVTPRPSGEQVAYRSIEPSQHRGDLVVFLVREGQALPPERYYATLGLAPPVPDAEMKRTYHRSALLWQGLLVLLVVALAVLLGF